MPDFKVVRFGCLLSSFASLNCLVTLSFRRCDDPPFLVHSSDNRSSNVNKWYDEGQSVMYNCTSNMGFPQILTCNNGTWAGERQPRCGQVWPAKLSRVTISGHSAQRPTVYEVDQITTSWLQGRLSILIRRQHLQRTVGRPTGRGLDFALRLQRCQCQPIAY
ncbi:hypothetical protein HDE_09392 [Halotydeus destructor]|nr:hypothetical protein HDE_09392 [Halotydeus destructor]